MVSKNLVSAPMIVLASGCAVVGPMYDRSYEKAPYSACADLTGGGAASIGQEPVRLGCFEAVARTFSAGQQISSGEHMLTPNGLRVTDAAAFRLAAGEGCTGQFSNFVIDYSAPAGATATITATDGLGRPLGVKQLRAKPSSKVERLVVREMGDPLKNPAVAEISSVDGELFVQKVCLKGY
ncbi:MAG TPA: hypothetical protein VF631_12770 [Allosphingosinicella sp.]|jgi:hypothetical protein|uniref:hypothetical protein n=1 Tax=Allosphingosinicella sp. TaxID=2823234 RepID=UPI002F29E3DA